MHQESGLLADHLHQPRMRVPQRIYADSRDQIQIALAAHIPNVTALAADQYQRVTSIILQQVFALEIHHGLRGGIHNRRWG